MLGIDSYDKLPPTYMYDDQRELKDKWNSGEILYNVHMQYVTYTFRQQVIKLNFTLQSLQPDDGSHYRLFSGIQKPQLPMTNRYNFL